MIQTHFSYVNGTQMLAMRAKIQIRFAMCLKCDHKVDCIHFVNSRQMLCFLPAKDGALSVRT
jgi:hypothetical protein